MWGFKSLSREVQKRYNPLLREEFPFLLTPGRKLADLIVGKTKVRNLIGKVNRAALDLDIRAGQLGEKATRKIWGLKKNKVFRSKIILEPKKKKKYYSDGGTGGKEYEIPSGLAPAKAIGAVALPLLGALKLEEMAGGKKDMSNSSHIKEADLRKTASMLISLKEERSELEKKARATELLYKQAELGQTSFPKTFEEYQEKVAELCGKNLVVVEEAIKMAAAKEEINSTFGDLGEETSSGGISARQMFQRSILDN